MQKDVKETMSHHWTLALPVEELYIFIPVEIKRVNIKQKEISPSSGALQPL